MTKERGELLHGMLEMLIMQTLTEGAQHGFAITRHMRSVSSDVLTVNEGSMYPALYRMQKRGWIDAEWGHNAPDTPLPRDRQERSALRGLEGRTLNGGLGHES